MKRTIANSSFNNPKNDLVRGFRQEELKLILKCIVPQFSSSMLYSGLGLPQVRNDCNKTCDFFCGCRCAAFVGCCDASHRCLCHWYIDIHTFQLHQIESSRKIAGAIPFTLSSNNSRCFGIVCFGKPKTWLSNKILIKLLNEQLTHEIRQFLWVVCCSLEVH